MSTKKRAALHAELTRQIRQFIAGAILFNQKVADREGLSLTDMQCMSVLDLLGPSTPGKLAEYTGLTTGGVTVMLDRLERAGYVKRERNPKDRRSVLVHVNPKKLERMSPYYAEINEQMEKLLSEMTVSDVEIVVEFLSRANSIRTDGGL
ncbi:MAG TPA: MarR family transcriptional regulator [Alloacidobacterium sp.]|jgi:DNA-binding MarR family transcriptional regulator|nr:MarR family transcriptional regulator [Alloacidobacterium sp.]